MVKTLYLHDYVVQVLETFGTLQSVINKIVDMAMYGKIDIECAPKAPPCSGCKQYFIDITNREYLDLLDIRGHKNNRLSLRRLVYQFVDQELYIDFNMAAIHELNDPNLDRFNIRLAKSIDELCKLYRICDGDTAIHIKGALTSLNNIKG